MTIISTKAIEKPVSRVDGPAKVTGAAKYAAEFNAPNLTYGFVVSSAIAKGRIKSIDRTGALAVPGVIEVFAHDNRPSVASSHKKYTDEAASPGSPFRPLLRRHHPVQRSADCARRGGRVRDRARCRDAGRR